LQQEKNIMKIVLEMREGIAPPEYVVEHTCKLIMWRKEFGGWLFSSGEGEPEQHQIPGDDIVGIIIEDDDAAEH
jgi:hypothetical protein